MFCAECLDDEIIANHLANTDHRSQSGDSSLANGELQ